MQEEKTNHDDGFRDMIKKRIIALGEWVKPNPGDPLYLTLLKSIYKGIALLLLLAVSPVILVILAIVFFATL